MLVIGLPAHAQTNWTGVTSTDWFTGSNWNTGVVPTSGTIFLNTITPNPTVVSGGAAVGDILEVLNGALTIQNNGTVNLSVGADIGESVGSQGAATVTGAGSTWNNGGLLSIGTIGTGTLTIANGGAVSNTNGFVAFAAGSQGAVTVTGVGSNWINSIALFVGRFGTGSLTIADGSTVSVAGGGGTAFVANQSGSNGSLNIGAAPGSAAAAPGTLNAAMVEFGAGSGTLNFNHTASNYVFASTVTGNGAVNVLSGTTTLAAANTYTGATNVNAGTLNVTGSIGPSGTPSGAINVLAGAALNVGPTGSINIGTNNLANAGTVTVAAGGSITDDLINSGVANNAGTLTGPVNNFGMFNNNVGGTVSGLLTNNSGTTTNTGALNGGAVVNGGLLMVDGTAAAVTVNPGGTLAGHGIVGNTTINGGVLSPGNSIGLLSVQGNLVFTAAASYLVEVSPSNADRTNVTGTATLGGATVNAAFGAGTYVARQYTILNAGGGVSGTFAGPVNTNLPANFKPSLSYDANNAYLNLTLNFIPPPSGGLNQNQQNVANAIVGFFNSNGAIPLVFGGLTPAGLTQASGEVATGSQQTTFDAMNLFLGLLTDPFIAGRADTLSAGASLGASTYTSQDKPRSDAAARDAYAAIYRKAPVIADPFTQRWSVWSAGYGGSQTTDGNAALGSNSTTSRIAGGVVGADYRFSAFTLAGFALAGGGTNFSVSNGLGSGRSDLFQAGAFIRHNVGPAYLSAALAYAWQDITTDRTVTVAGIDQLRAQFNANAWSGRLEGGYRFVSPWMGIGVTPYAAGQFTTFDLPAYAEQAVIGANTFALAYGSKSVTASRSELGLRTDKSFVVQDGIFTLRGRAAWAHDFNTDRAVGATFQTLPGASFVVNGAAQSHDAALVTASAEMKWLNGWSAATTFEGEFSSLTTSYAGKGVVRYAW
ncbi:autotransporter domain-containing protein [Bradyrhizobium sp. MOS001]|uniref:autotransporter outer membrane beta-barrel domain-containing protein n=1 Tax=Bradyrhizobium sp. MOS001 TaxID=2133948 RepID=UPI001FCE7682|nr:autotransporter domain-containing protein [Bradyrhizobium sp. MOS001]